MTYAIAHRGLAIEAVENTLAAVDAALDHVKVIEIDVRCTQDAVAVCAHDASLARAWEVDAKVGQLDHEQMHARVPDLPTLAEMLDLIDHRGGAAMLDVKVSRPRAIEAIEQVVARSSMVWNDGRQLRRGAPIEPGSVTFQSADAQLLQAFRSRTGAGCVELVRAESSPRELMLTAPFITAYAQAVTIPDTHASRRMLSMLRRLRLGSYVYTVNDGLRYDELERHGASGVYTDRVDRIGAVVA